MTSRLFSTQLLQYIENLSIGMNIPNYPFHYHTFSLLIFCPLLCHAIADLLRGFVDWPATFCYRASFKKYIQLVFTVPLLFCMTFLHAFSLFSLPCLQTESPWEHFYLWNSISVTSRSSIMCQGSLVQNRLPPLLWSYYLFLFLLLAGFFLYLFGALH